MKVFEVINWAKGYLKEKKREDPYLDAQILLSYILNLSKGDLYLIYQQKIRDEDLYNYQKAIKRRGEGEPSAYIIGYSEFMSLKFMVNPQVFIPRPETEILVEKVVERVRSAECGVRSAECGVRSAECGMRDAECGVRSAECGVRSAECGVRSAECGVRSAECGVRSAECGVRSAECKMGV